MSETKIEIRQSEYGGDHYYIRHGENTYTLKVDNNNRLVLSACGDCLVLRPIAANCIIIDKEL